jgi:hypothetical protein
VREQDRQLAMLEESLSGETLLAAASSANGASPRAAAAPPPRSPGAPASELSFSGFSEVGPGGTSARRF